MTIMRQRLFSISFVLALITGLFLVTFSISLAGARPQGQTALASSLGLSSLPPADYDSGWVNLPQAVAWDNPGTIIYPDDVYPSETTFNHNLGTYGLLVYVLASDGQSRYVPMPNALVGGYGHEDNWFLTSQNQIMLRNWDYNRAVPVHVMIWKLTPDYDSGWINLPKATHGPGILPPVYPTETTLNHNLGTYDLFVFVLANDGSGKYAQIPSEAIGSYGGENVWFLTSSNQIMLRNWDPYRTVPVHVMIWRAYPDYDSGWVNLPKAVPWDNPGTIIYPDDVTPTETSLNHNLGTYNILVNVMANDGAGRYVQIPVGVVGGGLWGEDNWFLTSQNQIMLRNWDYNRAVPVHVMIWKPKVQVTFSQTGLASDFAGTVLTVDSNDYNVTDLPVSFSWNLGSSHSFAYQSPLLVTPNAKQYCWTSTSGLSSLQSGSIAVATSGTITGNYKTQYYLAVTSSYDSPNPSSGWFDAGSSVTASVTSPWSGSIGTQYVCTGWSGTGSVPASGTAASVTFMINAASSITWNWKTQYQIIFDQTGVEGDFTSTVVVIDGVNYKVTDLSAQFWWNASSVHTFAYQSPLVVSPSSKQYVWTSTSGLSTLQSDTITVSASGSITGNYKTQYYLTVTSLYDSPIPTSGWFDADKSITASVTSPWSGSTGTRYLCTGWTGTGSVPPSGTGSSVTFTLTQASSINWNWIIQYYLTVKTDPSGIATIPGEGWYNSSKSVPLTAPSVSGYTFLNWDIDGASQGSEISSITVSMNAPHTATAHYRQKQPLSVSISPLSANILVGQSVPFTSTVNGGTPPYSFQWYLNSNPVSGAIADQWTFTPTTTGIYYIYLRVTDADNTIVQSETARVTVTSIPVGGYSVPINEYTTTKPSLTPYLVLVAILTIGFTTIKRKATKRKTK